MVPRRLSLLYDDGNARILSEDYPAGHPHDGPRIAYSRATYIQIDESTNVYQWQYLPCFFSFWGGSINVF